MWIPFRSVKMKPLILGFHRRVWCPKWTPASSNSFSSTCCMSEPDLRLPLGELEAFPGARVSVFLPFHHARIAGEKPVTPQRGTVLLVSEGESPGDTELKGLPELLMEQLEKTKDPRVVGGAELFEQVPYLGSGPRHPSYRPAVE